MADETFEEFQYKLLKRDGKRIQTMTNGFGSKYVYRSVGRDNPIKLVKENDFLHIIRNVNNSLSDELAIGTPIYLPYIGKFYLREKVTSAAIVDGMFVTNKHINWVKTHKLWYEEPETMKKGMVVRDNNDFICYVVWAPAKFKNMYYPKFSTYRSLKYKIRDNIVNNEDMLRYRSRYGY